MTQLLLRFFVKDPHDSPAGRAAIGRLAGLTGICCNVLLFLGKLLVGIAVGSIAVMADAFNNLSDAASSLVTLLGFHLAQRPADADHPFGHARYEYLAALAVNVLILVVGLELAKTSIQKILLPAPLETDVLANALLLSAIGVKLWMYRFYKKLGTEIQSPVLLASGEDSRNDVTATTVVLISCLIYQVFGVLLDGYAGLGVAVFILISGVKAFGETLSPLLGTRPSDALVQQLNELVLSHEKVLGVHDLMIHDYGPGQCFATIHAEVSAQEDSLHTHDLLEDIEEDALQRLHVHLVIHCDPVVENNAELEHLRALTDRCAAALDSRLSVHDLHLANHEGVEKLVFDVAIPYSMDCNPAELETQLCAALREQGVQTDILIHLDRT